MSATLKGVLLVDVGTPKELTKESVQEYLNEFLGDPFVIRGPKWLREILFKRIIIPLRSEKSLEKYRRIWTPEGSPLRVGAQNVAALLERDLNTATTEFTWIVRSAFHYGGPAIESTLLELRRAGVEDLIIVPLYPQWALSTRGSLEDRLKKQKVFSDVEGDFRFSRVAMTSIFYDRKGFIEAQAELLKRQLPSIITDDVGIIFSFHGLPQSHITAAVSSCKSCLKREGECRPDAIATALCYRHQCFDTAKSIANKIGLKHWHVAFQSRLGPTRWLEPSLVDVVEHLREDEVTTLVVQCPSFVFDCLETLEEVGLEARDQFLSQGGQKFTLVPALNSSPAWLKTLKCLVLEQIGVVYENCASTPSSTTP